MALSVDGMAVLATIGANRRLFADVELEAAKAARTLVIKQLKARTSDLTVMREIREALGRDNFVLIVETMTPAEVKSLANKFDKYRPELKSSDAAWRRKHLCELADGKVDVSAKSTTAQKASPKPKPKTQKPKVLDLLSMKTSRGRRK